MALRACRLVELANCILGYKSLQNDFFYVDDDAVAKYGIEPEFLRPLFMMRDVDAGKYLQKGKRRLQLFYCTKPEADLRGTGALKYLRAMADRPAAARKQKQAPQTMREALQAQSGGRWYHPKAQLHMAHLWVRKAFASTYSPFVFETAAAMDQRCNAVLPTADLAWDALGALMTSSLFALSLESQGSATMGAGALEVPTKALREVKVLDIRELSKAEQTELAKLGRAVWKSSTPLDWGGDSVPGAALDALDGWLLRKAEASVSLEKLQSDIKATCASRLRLGADKAVREKAVSRGDVAAVARAIAELVRAFMEAKPFPESFVPEGASKVKIEITREAALSVEAQQMFGSVALKVGRQDGPPLLEAEYPKSVAQVLVAALLFGRSTIPLPLDEAVAEECLTKLVTWKAQIGSLIDDECRRSSLGSRFEDEIRAGVFRELGIARAVMTTNELTGQFLLPGGPPAS